MECYRAMDPHYKDPQGLLMYPSTENKPSRLIKPLFVDSDDILVVLICDGHHQDRDRKVRIY
jgi:hypothetical protein